MYCYLWSEYTRGKNFNPFFSLFMPDKTFNTGFSVGEVRRLKSHFFESHFFCEFCQIAEKVSQICIWVNDYAFCLVKFESMFPIKRFISKALADCKVLCWKI